MRSERDVANSEVVVTHRKEWFYPTNCTDSHAGDIGLCSNAIALALKMYRGNRQVSYNLLLHKFMILQTGPGWTDSTQWRYHTFSKF